MAGRTANYSVVPFELTRLGFTCGATEERPIGVGSRWAIHGFHLNSPQVIGRLDVSLSIHPMAGQSLDVALFDALGNCVFRTTMTGDSVRFDQIRLAAGDYMLAYRSPGPGAKGTGSYHAPQARLLADELPEQPDLDAILAEPTDGRLGECGCPTFHFSAR